MNSHIVLAMVSEKLSPRGPNALLSPLRISFTTASRVGSSSLTKSLHVIVSAPGGAGTSDVEVVIVRGRVAVVDAVVDVGVEPPGSVVIATEPPVVLTHAARPRHMTAVATTRTGMAIPPTLVVPLGMPTDVPPAADTPPIDELSSAEATLAQLRQVVQAIAAGDLGSQTPCREFDVAALTDHLMNSITTIGGVAEADLPPRNRDDSVERQIILAARPALDAWRTRGVDGTVQLGSNKVLAKVMAGVLSLEFLVHAWDYAQATGQKVQPPEEVAAFVFGLARQIITPQGHTNVGFDDPVDVPESAPVFDRLIAFTGRAPR
jgi:uncharacterized protein (TIGR03086 family)